MKTLVIYDNGGQVYLTRSGPYDIPLGGVQYLEVEVVDGKYVKSVDTSETQHKAVLEDVPLSDTELLKKRVEEQESALIELASLIGGTV